MHLGLTKQALSEISSSLSGILADTYALYLKTQNFHWNLQGMHFFALHLLFEKQYEEMADAVDEIAERIRSLGCYVDGSFTGFKKMTSIPEAKKGISDKKMLQALLDGHERLSFVMRSLIPHFQSLKDEASADLLIKRLGIHEKMAWMLRAHLE